MIRRMMRHRRKNKTTNNQKTTKNIPNMHKTSNDKITTKKNNITIRVIRRGRRRRPRQIGRNKTMIAIRSERPRNQIRSRKRRRR